MSTNRIESLDLIRGIAVLGILFMNALSMLNPIEAYAVPNWGPNIGLADHWIYAIQSLFVESRFMSLFALLFGIGLTIQWQNLSARGAHAPTWLRRRLTWLLVFGLLHGLLIWPGDILATYAICGLLLLTMRHWRVRTKLWVGCLFIGLAQPVMLMLMAGSLITGENLMALPELPYSAAQLSALRSELGSMSFLTSQAVEYVGFVLFVGPTMTFWQVTGTMLIGSALYQRGFFERFQPWALFWLVAGFAWGAAVYYFRLQVGIDSSASQATVMLMMPGGLAMGIGYASLLVPLARRSGLIIRMFKNAGKTAFTLYLSQSLILVAIFQWLAPQWWGVLNRPQAWLVVLAVVIAQLIFAHWWQTHRGQGPLEKLWRRLSYAKLERQQP